MSSDDDEHTPDWRKQRRPLHLVGAVRRPTNPAGVPSDYAEAIDTGVYEMLDRELAEDEIQIVQRSRRDSGDPLTVADAAKILKYAKRQAEKAEQSGQRRQVEQLKELLAVAPHSRPHRTSLWVKVIAAVGAALGGGGAGIAYHGADERAARDAVVQVKLERAMADLTEVRDELRRMTALVERSRGERQ